MLWISGIGLVVLAVVNHASTGTEHGSLWHVLLAIAAFLYLWWLGSILFDLVFIWHRYIQADAAHEFLRRAVAAPSFRPGSGPEGPRGPTADIRPPGPGSGAPSLVPVGAGSGTVYVETRNRPSV